MTAKEKKQILNPDDDGQSLPVEVDDSMIADNVTEQEPLENEAIPDEDMVLEDDETPSEESVTSKAALKEEHVDDGRQWFAIHCYSGQEKKVRKNLEQRIETMNMRDKIFDVVIATQEEIEVRDGKRKTVERNSFPGYVLVNMILEEESWFVVRNTPGVTGLAGMGEEPTALRPEEVAQILRRMEDEAPTYKVTYKQGEHVRIVDGPFKDFRGSVAEIDMERSKIRVMVNFFGRETPVELDFLQVERA